jgi:hypothetical protein
MDERRAIKALRPPAPSDQLLRPLTSGGSASASD